MKRHKSRGRGERSAKYPMLGGGGKMYPFCSPLLWVTVLQWPLLTPQSATIRDPEKASTVRDEDYTLQTIPSNAWVPCRETSNVCDDGRLCRLHGWRGLVRGLGVFMVVGVQHVLGHPTGRHEEVEHLGEETTTTTTQRKKHDKKN